MFGSVIGAALGFGGTPPAGSHSATFYVGSHEYSAFLAASAAAEREHELLKKHGRLWYAGATWQGPDGCETSFKAGPYISEAERDAAMRQMLIAFGYKRPKWWQLTRRKECAYWRYLKDGECV